MPSESYKSLGQALQLIEALQCKSNSVVDNLKLNWANIFPDAEADFTPANYNPNTHILIIKTSLPNIYVQHYHDHLRAKINEFFGKEIVKSIKFRNS